MRLIYGRWFAGFGLVSDAVGFWPWILVPIPCGVIKPEAKAIKMKMNKTTDRPMRTVRALTAFAEGSLPWFWIKLYSAEPRLNRMTTKAAIAMILMNMTGFPKKG